MILIWVFGILTYFRTKQVTRGCITLSGGRISRMNCRWFGRKESLHGRVISGQSSGDTGKDHEKSDGIADDDTVDTPVSLRNTLRQLTATPA
jgi:hypothetical protein